MRRIYYYFRNFITKRWFITLLGVIAIGLLIWFIGPLFAFAGYAPLEEYLHRWISMGLVFLIWVVTRCWSYFKARRQNNQVVTAMASVEEPGLSTDEQLSLDEVDGLKKRMVEALEALKASRLGKGPNRLFLYQLPWYIIIGPPGTGKTTLLKNSDLKFPLSDKFGKDAVRGVGGTRNCDWWFAEEAVLLDTAGRYTTQDSHEPVDQAAWSGFLDLLKKNRSRRPINGIIIAVSLADLLGQNSEQHLAQARTIRKRIQELHERFNIRFPVYLLFTKCDLLAGFKEYFDDLDRGDRSQVWGMTFKLDGKTKQNVTEQFKLEFELLQQQLQNQLLDKLERERGRERREKIYTFPQQFNVLNELISPFIDELFQSSQYAHEAMFRGVYFTSATQEGSPIDRIMGALSSSFGLNPHSQPVAVGQGKSFFINHLLREVIFAESGLAGANLKLEKRRRWFQNGAFVGVIVLTSLMAFAWVTSFINNKAYVKEVSEKTAVIEAMTNEINTDNINPLSILPLLNKARDITGGYTDQHSEEGTPWRLSFGLFQGDKLGDASLLLYKKLLKDVLLPRLMARSEKQLKGNTNNPEYLYEALKPYLMLSSSEHYDANVISAWYSLDWKYNLPIEVTTKQRESLNQHLQVLLERRSVPLPRPLDGTLIKKTQGLLLDTPLAQRVYSGLKSELKKNAVKDYKVNEKAGRDASLILASKSGKPLTTGVASLFTCKGYKNVFLKSKEILIARQVKSNWVYGTQQDIKLPPADLKLLEEDVLKLYLEEYIERWEGLLSDIQIKPFTSQKQLIDVLNIVSGTHSPIKSFITSVDYETSMRCLNSKDKSLMNKAEDGINRGIVRVERLIRSTSDKDNQNRLRPRVTTNLVIDHFKRLHELVLKKDDTPPPLDRTLSVLNELHVYLNSIQHASGDELVTEQRQQIIQVIDKVKLEGKRNPYPVSDMMDKIARSSHNLVSGGVRKHLNAMWRSSVLPFCQQAIQGLYPIGKQSREITFEDFTYFFGPGGLMDEFFKKYLNASVEKSGGKWRWNTRGKGGAGISSAALQQFQRADNIKNIFFRMGKDSPKVGFKLKPITMSSSIVQFIIDVDGQTLTYAHGPLRPLAMNWPGPNDSDQVRIQLLPPLQGYSGLSKEGPWALFRMFDEAHLTRTSNPAVFIMTFTIQGREAKFELRANSAVSPFQLTDLQSFQCPQNL